MISQIHSSVLLITVFNLASWEYGRKTIQRGGTKTQIIGNLHSHKWKFLVQNVQANLTVQEKCKVVIKQKMG